MYLYGLTGLRLSCPHAGVTDTSRWLLPPLRADAVAKRYRPWPKGLRADSLPWFDSPLVQGASRLRYTDKAQLQRPGHTGRKALATKKRLLPPLRPPRKKKQNRIPRFLGGAVWVLAGCVCCSCVLLRLCGFTLSLPKVASHGDDVGNDSWLKWQSTLLTVLRHSWICRRHRIG